MQTDMRKTEKNNNNNRSKKEQTWNSQTSNESIIVQKNSTRGWQVELKKECE